VIFSQFAAVEAAFRQFCVESEKSPSCGNHPKDVG
jgi:hypothetical protein